MADDWESIAQIEPQLNSFDVGATREEILDTIRQLHAGGYLRAMDENGHRLDVYPDDQETAWFSMTEIGRKLFEENAAHYGSE